MPSPLLLLAAAIMALSYGQQVRALEIDPCGAVDRFQDRCLAYASGYIKSSDGRLVPSFATQKCTDSSMFLSVTHENESSNHFGSKNFDPGISSYISDYSYAADLNKWISASISDGKLTLILDTRYSSINETTGWPLTFGYLFAGVTDRFANQQFVDDIVVKFDFNITEDVQLQHPDQAYSGRRILFGALLRWDEAKPRTNRSHFLEVDLSMTPGYWKSSVTMDPSCRDEKYNRCFYDKRGRYAEGRELSLSDVMKEKSIYAHSKSFGTIEIRLSDLVKDTRWASPPLAWRQAQLGGLYFAIESRGRTRTAIEIEDYSIQIQHTDRAQCKP